jgi:hypothetical protein
MEVSNAYCNKLNSCLLTQYDEVLDKLVLVRTSSLNWEVDYE